MAGGALRTALVTGASSGIGAACVRVLSDMGLDVWALARRGERLDALADDTGCIKLSVDIRDGAALETAVDGVSPDVLINNAGLGAGITGLVGASRDDLERTIGTNVTALLDITRLVLPGMIARGHGHVVNIGSVAGLYPINSVVYGGSKGAVHLISQNLRLELKGTGVRITEICPGRVSTEFMSVAVPQGADFPAKTPITEMQSEDIAAAVGYAVGAPAHVNVSLIELQPTEQTFGGLTFDPLEWDEQA